MGGWQEGGGQRLSLTTPHLEIFGAAGKKALCQICFKVLNLHSLAGMKESRWTGFFGTRRLPERQLAVFVQAARWKTDNRPPVEDSRWSNSYKQIQSAPGSRAGGGVYFLFSDWDPGAFICSVSSADSTVWVLKRWFQGLGENFSFGLFIFGPKYMCSEEEYTHIGEPFFWFCQGGNLADTHLSICVRPKLFYEL